MGTCIELHYICFVFVCIFCAVQLPKNGTLWSVYMNFSQKRLEPWEKIIPLFKYNREQPFFEMLVPTTDTVRYGYLMEKLLSVRRSVIFTGDTGVGKVKINSYS